MRKAKFSKGRVLLALIKLRNRIQTEQKFDPCWGTRQLNQSNPELDELISRAVEYGRWQAFHQFHGMACDNFHLLLEDDEK